MLISVRSTCEIVEARTNGRISNTPHPDAVVIRGQAQSIQARDHSHTLKAAPAADGGGHHGTAMSEPLPKHEFDRIFSKVPRLTVEVLIRSEERGILLALRDVDPCRGTWNLPGGTVRFGERLVDAVRRVAGDELGIDVRVGPLLGYIEYPSHYGNGLDSPVGLVFPAAPLDNAQPRGQWFTALPENMHEEQKEFLVAHAQVSRAAGRSV